MSESATARRVAIGLAISAFVLAAVALVVALARRGEHDSVPAPAPIAQAPPVHQIRRLDATHAVIARDTADQLIAHPADLAAVHEVSGVGFQLESIPPKGPLAQLGFEAGDTVRGVNGMDVATPAAALQMVTQLKSTTRFTIDLDRRGSALQLTIDIR